MFDRLRGIQIMVPFTGWTFFTLICCNNITICLIHSLQNMYFQINIPTSMAHLGIKLKNHHISFRGYGLTSALFKNDSIFDLPGLLLPKLAKMTKEPLAWQCCCQYLWSASKAIATQGSSSVPAILAFSLSSKKTRLFQAFNALLNLYLEFNFSVRHSKLPSQEG